MLALLALLLASCTYLPNDFAVSGSVTESETRDAIVLVPTGGATHQHGFIFYPGALVDPHAYVPELSAVAAAGIPVVIAKLPGNLAVLSIDAGLALRDRVPGMDGWVIGGHSLGGVMAAWSAYDNPDAYVGLVFFASYPSASTSLASWGHPVLSLSASDDGLATADKVGAADIYLPSPQASATDLAAYSGLPPTDLTVHHVINGGNHAGFGSYGPQDGDGAATITPEAQHAEVASFIEAFFTKQGW